MSTWSRRRVLALGVTAVALAGCVDSGDDGTADGDDDSVDDAGTDDSVETDDGATGGTDSDDGQTDSDDDEGIGSEGGEPVIQSSEIETIDIGGRSGDTEKSTYEIDGETVTIEGVLPTNNICQDRRATLESVEIEERVLAVSLGFDRDSPESPCMTALGQLEYLATIIVTNAQELEDVTVRYPEGVDEQPHTDDDQSQAVDADDDDGGDDSY